MQSDKTKILFVDDDPSLLAGLRRSLHRLRDQWDTHFCTRGAEALERLAQDEYHVVVSDIRMPEMDGVKLMRRVQAEFPQIVRIILSGQAEQSKVLQLTEVAHQYFSKPCFPDHLLAAINNIHCKQAQFDSSQLVRYLTGLASFPMYPDQRMELNKMLEQSDVTLDSVIDIVESDAGLTLKVLQLVNSNFFGDPSPENSVEVACQKLGLEVLRVVLLNSQAIDGFEIECESRNSISDSLSTRLHQHWLATSSNDEAVQLSAVDFGKPAVEYVAALWGIGQ